ncbi:MAG: tetratricopeptide repeat protein [Pseudomonadota bacterium]
MRSGLTLLVSLALLAGPWAAARAQGVSGASSMDLPNLDFATLPPGVRGVMEEAASAEARGENDRAAARYRLVLRRDATLVPAVLGLGRVLVAQGDLDGADRILASMPHEAEVVRARALLLEERNPEEALALYRRLETLAMGSADPYLHQAALLAGRDPTAALAALETWWELDGGPPTPEVVVSVALGLKEAGGLDEAQALLERARTAWPEEEVATEAVALYDRLGVEREALRLGAGGLVPLTATQDAALQAARARYIAGELDRALEDLRELAGQAPHAPEVWAALGDVHLARGTVTEAERAYVAATTLAPDEAAYHARLGMLLAERYAGRRHREAIAELSAALALRPTWAELLFRQAQVLREAGRFEAAAGAYTAYLALDPDGPHAGEARQTCEDLERHQPSAGAEPWRAPPAAAVPDPARQACRVARVYRQRGDLEAARREVERALALAPDYLEALLLRAAIQLGQGDEAGARVTYTRCLEVAPEDPRLLLNLGELERAAGLPDAARERFLGAAQAGAPEAWYLLADMADEDGQPSEARRYLQAYFAESTGGLALEPARALEARLLKRLWLLRGLAGGTLAGSFMLLGGLVLRRRTGADLGTLLAREPSSYHEVARLLSAIRHEVLKHNTTLLATVAERLEAGEEHAALYAAERLYGDRGEAGVISRFESYLSELEALGRRHGVRLNLRVRDPVLAPMHRAMRRLQRLEPALRRPHRARRGRLAAELRLLSTQLNQVGFRALGRIIRDVSLQPVSLAFFEAVYVRVAAEPALVGEAPAALEQAGETAEVPVRMFRQDLEDVATNLLRNALLALAEELPRDERRVGVAIEEELDPVTGLETLAVRFRDNAPRPLADAILRGRSIERGLGLAADLLARHQGVMSVEQREDELRAGWTKAVVVRLPRAELTEEERP